MVAAYCPPQGTLSFFSILMLLVRQQEGYLADIESTPSKAKDVASKAKVNDWTYKAKDKAAPTPSRPGSARNSCNS